MLSLDKATRIVKKVFPEGIIDSNIEYKNLYVFQVLNPILGEEGLDPFFSVNKETGELRDFSIFTDGDITEISDLFVKARQKNKRR